MSKFGLAFDLKCQLWRFQYDLEERKLAVCYKLQGNVWLSRLFSSIFERHQAHHHNADYEVCRHWPCRIGWWLERQLWYGGADC